MIAWLGLDKERDTVVKEMTLAERKLIEVGRAVATKPKLLLLDEVVAGLNPTEVDRMIELIKEINRSGITLIVVEHVMKVVMSVSDRIVVLDRGAKVAEGNPQEVPPTGLVPCLTNIFQIQMDFPYGRLNKEQYLIV